MQLDYDINMSSLQPTLHLTITNVIPVYFIMIHYFDHTCNFKIYAKYSLYSRHLFASSYIT